MNKILYALIITATLTSCAESYSIQGSSSVSSLDGSKLYLKTVKDQELKNLDSCDVVHGKFRFAGLLDTVKLANLYMDDEPLMMPVVVEKGEIEIRIEPGILPQMRVRCSDSVFPFLCLGVKLGGKDLV